jgi:hypothetical protein
MVYFCPMLGRLYENQEWSAARTLELVGKRWSLLIQSDALAFVLDSALRSGPDAELPFGFPES